MLLKFKQWLKVMWWILNIISSKCLSTIIILNRTLIEYKIIEFYKQI